MLKAIFYYVVCIYQHRTYEVYPKTVKIQKQITDQNMHYKVDLYVQ